MTKTRRERTKEAILRAVLGLVLSGDKLTKSKVCEGTPCSPATLFRFYPDLEAARLECFGSSAAHEIISPYIQGLHAIEQTQPDLSQRLKSIIRLQHAFVLSQLNFVREITRASIGEEWIQEQSIGNSTTAFCRRLAEQAMGDHSTSQDIGRLDAQLQPIIGFQAMYNGYQVSQKAGIPYPEHADLLAKALLDQYPDVH